MATSNDAKAALTAVWDKWERRNRRLACLFGFIVGVVSYSLASSPLTWLLLAAIGVVVSAILNGLIMTIWEELAERKGEPIPNDDWEGFRAYGKSLPWWSL